MRMLKACKEEKIAIQIKLEIKIRTKRNWKILKTKYLKVV